MAPQITVITIGVDDQATFKTRTNISGRLSGTRNGWDDMLFHFLIRGVGRMELFRSDAQHLAFENIQSSAPRTSQPARPIYVRTCQPGKG